MEVKSSEWIVAPTYHSWLVSDGDGSRPVMKKQIDRYDGYEVQRMVKQQQQVFVVSLNDETDVSYRFLRDFIIQFYAQGLDDPDDQVRYEQHRVTVNMHLADWQKRFIDANGTRAFILNSDIRKRREQRNHRRTVGGDGSPEPLDATAENLSDSGASEISVDEDVESMFKDESLIFVEDDLEYPRATHLEDWELHSYGPDSVAKYASRVAASEYGRRLRSQRAAELSNPIADEPANNLASVKKRRTVKKTTGEVSNPIRIREQPSTPKQPKRKIRRTATVHEVTPTQPRRFAPRTTRNSTRTATSQASRTGTSIADGSDVDNMALETQEGTEAQVMANRDHQSDVGSGDEQNNGQ